MDADIARAVAPDRQLAPAEILVVDDDKNNLIAIDVALGDDLAERTVKVQSGHDALRALLRQDFAVILLDVQMPGLDGFETARLIRSRHRNRHVPIIFVTAFSQGEADIRRGYGLGGVDYLFKPIVEDVLRAKVQMFVELRERTLQVAAQAEQLRAAEQAAAERKLIEERRQWEAEALRKQYAQLEEADRRKDQFIAMLAHELRNPLAPVVAALELMRMTDLQDPIVDKARDAMSRQVTHLVRLVDDLLDVSRISQNKIDLSLAPLDVCSVVEEARESCAASPAAAGRTLRTELPDAPVWVRADRVRLSQVVQNLVNNALRYSDAEDPIDIVVSGVGEEASIRVTDQGHGIEPELLDRIFDVFVQARRGGQGLGLGLTLVKQLVEMHSGKVTAHSDGPGTGSSFEVRLPLGAAPAAPHEEGASEVPEPDGPLRIALVDDDADIRSTMSALLESWGHEVRVAATGPSGVALVVEMRPDVAVLDIGLPELDGYGVARSICERLANDRPRLVAVSGYGQAPDRARSKDAGFDSHLLKPARPEKLRRALRGD